MQEHQDVGNRRFTWFDKAIVRGKDLIWANLPQPSKAIYPYLLMCCDSTGKAYPAETTIAEKCGMREKTVRSGVKGLAACMPGFKSGFIRSSRGRWQKAYWMNRIVHYEAGNTFRFFASVIDSHTWADLRPASKSLYVAIRCFTFPDHDVFPDAQDGNLEEGRRAVYGSREYDLCEMDREHMIEYAGICRRSVVTALRDLQEHRLVSQGEKINGIWTRRAYRMPGSAK